MLVTLLVKFRNKDYKTTELGFLLQVLPVRIVTFVETLRSHLNYIHIQDGGFLLKSKRRINFCLILDACAIFFHDK